MAGPGTLVLLAVLALVVDRGMLWVVRAEAQNLVDAAAHAGAVELQMDPAASDDAMNGAMRAVAAEHTIRGITPVVTTWVASCPSDRYERGELRCCVAQVEGVAPAYFGGIWASKGTRVAASAMASVYVEPGPPPVRRVHLVR